MIWVKVKRARDGRLSYDSKMHTLWCITLMMWHLPQSSLVLRVKKRGKCQGRVAELFPRSSFDILQGCTNSGSGRIGIPEVTWMDRLGFSLAA